MALPIGGVQGQVTHQVNGGLKNIQFIACADVVKSVVFVATLDVITEGTARCYAFAVRLSGLATPICADQNQVMVSTATVDFLAFIQNALVDKILHDFRRYAPLIDQIQTSKHQK